MAVIFYYPSAGTPDPNVNYGAGEMGGMSYNNAMNVYNSPGPSFGDIVKQIAPAALAVLAPALAPELFAAAPALEGSELAALQADAAIQSGLAAEAGTGAGVGAGVAGADAVMPGTLASEIAGESTVAPDVLANTSPQDLANALRTDTGTAQLGSGTSLSSDAATNPLNQFNNVANPEVQANTGTVSNLVGGGSDANLATLDATSNNPLLPTSGEATGGSELGAKGSIISSGEGLGTQTLSDTLAPTGLNGLTVNDLNSQPLLNNGTVSTTSAKDVADALRRANQLKNLLSFNQQLVKNQQTLKESQALSNLLKTNQFTPMAVPEVYKAQNPFTFSPQEPIQGNPLASLLRNNYGNS
jgi:hypothetical protein